MPAMAPVAGRALNNPYAPKSGSLFFGREAVVRRMLADEQNGQSIVLIAGRRCGKTRLLQRLHGWLLASADSARADDAWRQLVPDAEGPRPAQASRPHLPVLIDLEGRAFAGLDEVLALVAGKMSAALAGVASRALAPPAEAGLTPSALEPWLRLADKEADTAGYSGFALLIDQVEDLFSRPWCHDFMSFLRLVDDNVLGSRVWIVLVGSNRLDGYENKLDGSPALNLLRRTDLGGLSYAARRRMVVVPYEAAGRLPPTDEQVRMVDQAAGGNVWLLTQILWRLFESDDRSCSHLHTIVRNVFDEEQDILRRWAAPLDEVAWEIYGDIVKSGRLDTQQIRGTRHRRARRMLEYQALVHAVGADALEPGPELFRNWAADEGHVRPPFRARQVTPDTARELPPGHFSYEVALSYAAPQQALAREIADHLQRLSIATFYDQQRSHEMWGADLAQVLPHTYGRSARIVVLLVSEDYVGRRWPMVEQAAAIERALREGWEGLLTVSVDGARLDQVPDSVVWMQLAGTGKGAADVALELQARLKAATAAFPT